MDSMPLPKSNEIPGEPVHAKDRVLETGAAATQNFAPVKQICAHLNAFHAYADEPGRCVEANHYCAHPTKDFRQCILYDSPGPDAKIIGIEYMVTPQLFETLPPEERKLWHSHVYEVKSGMLVMPTPSTVPEAVWEKAEVGEMKEIIRLYGKAYHLWQTDRGDQLPLGEPKLMTSYVADGQFGFERLVGDRDRRFGSNAERKREIRKDIDEPTVHEDADWIWKQKRCV